MYYGVDFERVSNEVHVFVNKGELFEWIDRAWSTRCDMTARHARGLVKEAGYAYLHGREADIPRSWRKGSCWDYEQTDDPNVDRTFDELRRYHYK